MWWDESVRMGVAVDGPVVTGTGSGPMVGVASPAPAMTMTVTRVRNGTLVAEPPDPFLQVRGS
jgi:hypothetical protein